MKRERQVLSLLLLFLLGLSLYPFSVVYAPWYHTEDFVDNDTSDVDSKEDVGWLTDFNNLMATDSNYANLSESGGDPIVSVEMKYLTFNPTETLKISPVSAFPTSNCVPFLTKKVNGTNSVYDALYFDIYFAGLSVWVQRQNGSGTVEVAIAVVEFNSTFVYVTFGTFNIADGETSGSTFIGSVDQTKAALIFYYKTNGAGSTVWGNGAVRGYFSSDNWLTFDRQGTEGYVSGHWFVFVALKGSFGVQAVDHSIPSDETLGQTTIPEVDVNKTFLISSYSTTGTTDDAESYAHYVHLVNSTTIESERLYAKDESIDCKVFLVSFPYHAEVQRGLNVYSSGSSYFEDTITAVNTTLSFAWNPQSHGLIQGNGTSVGDEECAFHRLELVNSTTVRGNRTSGQAGEGAWEVIEFSLGHVTFQFEHEVQFTNITYDLMPTERLCIYAGTLGSEDLNVTYWDGDSWELIASDLTANQWNNLTVSLTSETYTIKFGGSNPSDDTAFDHWMLDAVLVRLSEYIESPQERVTRWVGVARPHAFAAISIMSLSLIIGIGLAFLNFEDMSDLPFTVIMGMGILIALFISLVLISAFSGL